MLSQRIERAQDFIWRNARLIDRFRFAYHFIRGPAEPGVCWRCDGSGEGVTPLHVCHVCRGSGRARVVS